MNLSEPHIRNPVPFNVMLFPFFLHYICFGITTCKQSIHGGLLSAFQFFLVLISLLFMLFLFLFFTFVQLNPAILDPWTLCKLWLSFFSLCAYWFRRKRKVCGEANSQHGGGILAWSFFFGWWEEVRMAIKNNKLRCSIHGNFPFLLYARAKKDTFTWLRNKCAANRVYQGFES